MTRKFSVRDWPSFRQREIIPFTTQEPFFSPTQIRVVDGRLSFDEWEIFYATLNILDGKDEPYLQKWEENVGFKSMRFYYFELLDLIESISETGGDFEAIRLKYQDVAIFYNETEVSINCDDFTLATLLDKHGCVLIKGTLHNFSKIINGCPGEIKIATDRSFLLDEQL